MDIDQIKELVRLMADNDLSELSVTDGQTKIHLKRGVGVAAAVLPAPPAGPASPAAAAQTAEPATELAEIRSPMVGTFYAAPSPDADPYVTVGSAVEDGAVVCIVEAMKVMNEIKADCSGTIEEICVRNAQPVEYGQILFRVRPD